ncbi:YjjG family noncanonical pyrimidine nucleotidase [Gaoshiqia sp. Z1-71]|uniref:YjjG family noncanonical pyrimidine nucleotidase n=1 Tax=Gaoshiqia hydrogeniformans TaxID=3290090 RepID=UPI003BF84953
MNKQGRNTSALIHSNNTWKSWGGRKYEHLFFDLDNTLWDFDINARQAMQETIDGLKLGNRLPGFDRFYHFYEELNSRLWEAYRKQEIRKPELIRKRFADSLAHFGIPDIDPVAMNELYLQHMGQQTKLVDGARETLTYLKKQRYQMHIITNGFKEVQLQKIQTCRLAPFFNGIFISEEVQAPKPDKHIFKHALMCSNAKKSKSLMIGDSWETDILGAKQVGIDQVYFQKNNKKIIDPLIFPDTNNENNHKYSKHPIQKTQIIENLSDLLRFL